MENSRKWSHVVWCYESTWAIPIIYRGRLSVVENGNACALRLTLTQRYNWENYHGKAIAPGRDVWDDVPEEVCWEGCVPLETLKDGERVFHHPPTGRRITVGELTVE